MTNYEPYDTGNDDWLCTTAIESQAIGWENKYTRTECLRILFLICKGTLNLGTERRREIERRVRDITEMELKNPQA